jgi:N-methylhydantoinase B/oxoprolinase/acetone carboxylase alpha subunit
MPPHSKSLADEGAAFKSFLLVDGGVFNESGIVKELTTPTGTASCGKSKFSLVFVTFKI